MPQSLDCDSSLSFFSFLLFLLFLFFFSLLWFSFVSNEIVDFTGIVYNRFYFPLTIIGIYSFGTLRRLKTFQHEAVLLD